MDIFSILKDPTFKMPLKLPLSVDVCASVTSWADKEDLTDDVLKERMRNAGTVA